MKNKKYAFYVGELEDGLFYATRLTSPNFFALGESKEDVMSQANSVIAEHRLILQSETTKRSVTSNTPSIKQSVTTVALGDAMECFG